MNGSRKMKRSDMIKILSSKFQIDSEVALDILGVVESFGMLPPYLKPPRMSVMEDEPKYVQYYLWEEDKYKNIHYQPLRTRTKN